MPPLAGDPLSPHIANKVRYILLLRADIDEFASPNDLFLRICYSCQEAFPSICAAKLHDKDVHHEDIEWLADENGGWTFKDHEDEEKKSKKQ